jgi:hypothetical protein
MKKRHFIITCFIIIIVIVGPGTVHAEPVHVGFFFDGLDLDTGTVEYERTILVILMGETIEEILRPEGEPLAEFSPSIDVSFVFDPTTGGFLDLILQDDVQIDVLEDISFEIVKSEMLGSLEFTDEPFSVPIMPDDIVVAWTAENRYFLLGEFQRSNWTLSMNIEDVTTNIIPEPSTLLLLGLGLVGLIHLVRRKRHLLMILVVALLANLWWAEIVHAQPSSLITVKKEGSGTGTVMIGDQACDSACMEKSVPYVEHRAVILKVIPDPDSYFAWWKTEDGEISKGTVRIQPGETVIAVFQKKWVPFDEVTPVETPTPPKIKVPISTIQELIVDVEIPGMNAGISEEEGVAYQHLSIPTSGHTTKVGHPQLPMLGRFLAIPAEAQVTVEVSVEVFEAPFQELEDYTIYPAQEPLPDIKDAPIPPFAIDTASYQQDAFYPTELATLEGPVTIRGNSMMILRMFPVQFNPVQKTLRVYSRLRVRLAFEGGKSYFVEERFRSPAFDQMFKNLLLNADTALSSSTAPDAAYEANNLLLIITHPNFLNAANTLAEWKIRKGIPTEVRSTTQTGNTAGAIQQYIQNAYDNWNPPPTYVLTTL